MQAERRCERHARWTRRSRPRRETAGSDRLDEDAQLGQDGGRAPGGLGLQLVPTMPLESLFQRGLRRPAPYAPRHGESQGYAASVASVLT